MRIPVSAAAQQLEARGLLRRERSDNSERLIARVRELLGRTLPTDLEDFYRERIAELGEYYAISPVWNDHVGWRSDGGVTMLTRADAVPLFGDGCGSVYGLDLRDVHAPAVYFFDHEDGFEFPAYACGSSLGAFMLLLADQDQAFREKWPEKWELKIDPDLERCPRAPAIWDAG